MSYLDAPRIHFFGNYFGNPSTINNDLSNYSLKPPLDLSWNPGGSAFFRFVDCVVSGSVGNDGTALSSGAADPITKATVTTPQSPPTKVAKIVDLDPDQQSITQLPERRSFIGSQVYFLGGPWEAWGQISTNSGAAISVLVFDNPQPIDNPTWADVLPVLKQYAVLYPAMTKRIDLSDYQAVFSNSAEILDVISLPIPDAAHMPVTRDLSAAHRTLIQTWIKNGLPRGESHA